MIKMSRTSEDELQKILNAYAALDPDGDFDNDEWEAFFNTRASERLKKERREVEQEVREARMMGIRL